MQVLNLNNVGQWEEDKFQFLNVVVFFISGLRELIFKMTFIGIMSFNKYTLASAGFPMFIWCKLKRVIGSNEKF